jgi:hypothetical protein
VLTLTAAAECPVWARRYEHWAEASLVSGRGLPTGFGPVSRATVTGGLSEC